MMKPDQRMRLQRIQRLRHAADVITTLRLERPDLTRQLHSRAADQLLALADAYEASPIPPKVLCKECREGTCKVHRPVLRMHDQLDQPRKPPQRVAMSRRRPIPTKPIPIAQREFDEEDAHEEGQTFGHDVPDGSD